MPPWRVTLPLFIVWTVGMAAWLLAYRGSDATCGPEIYRDCQIGLKVTTGLGRPGIALLWSLGVVALVMTWLVTRRLRLERGEAQLAAPVVARVAHQHPARRLRLKRRLSGLPAPGVGRSRLRRRAGAWSPPRNVVALALVIGAAAAGVLGFTLARSGGDESQTTAKPTRLPAQREWAAALHATDVALERLHIRRTSALRRLATAPTRRAQTAAAARLVGAYGAAARAVPTEFRETARTSSALDDARQAYRRLLAAARGGSRRRYAIAGRAVRRRERDLQRAIARLNRFDARKGRPAAAVRTGRHR